MPVLNSSSSYLDSISTTIIVQYNQRSFAAHANKQKPPLLRFACKRQRHTLECIVSKRTAIHFVECSPSPNRKWRTQTESRVHRCSASLAITVHRMQRAVHYSRSRDIPPSIKSILIRCKKVFPPRRSHT